MGTLAGWWREWVAGPPDRWVSLSLFVALLLLSPPSPRQDAVAVHMVVLGVLLALSLRWRVAPFAILGLLFAGLELRLAYFGSGFSDVLIVTQAAIEQVLAGGNPYGHGYAETVPPGAPYPYGPLALLWYLPALGEPRAMEVLSAAVVLGLLAVRGRLLGLAIYACAP